MGAPFYATREQVMRAVDVKESARESARIDRIIDSESRTIEQSTLNRVFYPWTGVRYFPWPDEQFPRGWRIWLDENELASLTTLVSGGVTIPATDYFLEPINSGPPYDRIEINLATTSAFSAGGTFQRSIAATGVYAGAPVDERAAATLAAAVSSASVTSVDVDNSASIGVGSLVKVDSERMIVTERSMLTTVQTLQSALTASAADIAVNVSNGAAYAVGETILLDSERMLIVDIAGNALTVKRAVDGSVLATHTGSTIYAPRRLTVERGAVGTTATTHSSSATVYRWVPPPAVERLCVAESVNTLLQETGGYTRPRGGGDNTQAAPGDALAELRKRAVATNGRVGRIWAV